MACEGARDELTSVHEHSILLALFIPLAECWNVFMDIVTLSIAEYLSLMKLVGD